MKPGQPALALISNNPSAGETLLAQRREIKNIVKLSIKAGFCVGRKVRLGCVTGRIVGYNIGFFGKFSGENYPLLVKTEFGVAKCCQQELILE